MSSAVEKPAFVRPESFVRYKPNYLVLHGNNEDSTADFLSTLHVVFSMLGLMMRLKWAGWLAVFFCTANFANSRINDENRQILMSSMMSVFSVVMCYVQNPLPMNLPLT